MEFGWVYLCLSVMLGGCSGQLSTSSEGPVASTHSSLLLSTAIEAMTSTENKTLTSPDATAATQGHSTEGPSVDDNSTSISDNITTSTATATPAESSSTPGVSASSTIHVVETDATTRTTKKTTTKGSYVPFDYQSLDASFKYDYHSLRIVGLSVAFVLFLTGILVIASSRVAKIPKCRKRSGKTYEVTRV